MNGILVVFSESSTTPKTALFCCMKAGDLHKVEESNLLDWMT